MQHGEVLTAYACTTYRLPCVLWVPGLQEMASRHRVRHQSIQIIKFATMKPSQCKRPNTLQFHDSNIKFPLTRKMARSAGAAVIYIIHPIHNYTWICSTIHGYVAHTL